MIDGGDGEKGRERGYRQGLLRGGSWGVTEGRYGQLWSGERRLVVGRMNELVRGGCKSVGELRGLGRSMF